jgi:uncharacterized membrane protein YcaP (DUF421 family)
MFDLDNEWYELIARAAIIYIALLVMVRVSGKRTVGQFTPFDLLVVMLLSEGVSNSLSGGEKSVLGGLLLAATLIVINTVLAFVGARNKKVQSLIEGEPVLIGRDGKIFDAVIRRHNVPHADVEQSLREADCELSKMKFAFLESDGKLSILKESTTAGDESAHEAGG